MNKDRPVHIMKASRLLQAKAGRGTIPEEKIKRSQKIIEQNTVDFVPLAREQLKRLRKATDGARTRDDIAEFSKDDLIKPVMHLKANAGMFKFPLISETMSVLLDFLETIKNVDEDVIEIIEANMKTTDAVLEERLTGDGGEYGREIVLELKNACRRYFSKHSENDIRQSGDGANLPYYVG